MTNPAFSLPPDDAVEALVNEVIDAEAAGENALALTLIRKGVAEYPGFGARLASTRAAVKSLRQPVFVPDQRTEVLVEVDYLRPFLSPRVRKQLSASRVAIAAGLVLTASVLTILQYVYPGITPEGNGAAPIGELVDASQADAAASVRSLASSFADLRDSVTEPVSTAMTNRDRGPMRTVSKPLSLGDLGAYDLDLEARSASRLAASLTLTEPAWLREGPSLARVASVNDATVATGLRLDSTPVTLIGDLGSNATVHATEPLIQLSIDADGVVLFGRPPAPKAPGIAVPPLK